MHMQEAICCCLFFSRIRRIFAETDDQPPESALETFQISTESESERDVDEVDAESLGMKFLANEKERLSSAKSLLLTSAQNGDWDGVRRALSRGAHVNAHDPGMSHWTPLHYAAEKVIYQLIYVLLDSPSVRSGKGDVSSNVCLAGLHYMKKQEM